MVCNAHLRAADLKAMIGVKIIMSVGKAVALEGADVKKFKKITWVILKYEWYRGFYPPL